MQTYFSLAAFRGQLAERKDDAEILLHIGIRDARSICYFTESCVERRFALGTSQQCLSWKVCFQDNSGFGLVEGVLSGAVWHTFS